MRTSGSQKPGRARAARDRLLVEHYGDERAIAPGAELTFGRSADLVIDVNPYLHRVLGRFRHDGRSWWLDNVGRAVTLTVLAAVDPSSATIGPGSSAPLLHAESLVAFTAGPAAYELVVTSEEAERRADLAGVDGPDGPLVTLEWGQVPLNADQYALLTVMCAVRRARPSDQWAPIPSNRECAAALGWTLAKWNRKLDHVCDKFQRSGVRGLHGDLGLSAMDRRRVLVDHVVRSGLLDRQPPEVVDRATSLSGPAARP